MTERPYLADDWRALAHEAEDALRRREATLDQSLEKGEVTKAVQLRAEIRVWRAIAADWHFVVFHERQTLPSDEAPVTGAEKQAAIADSLARCRKALVKAHDRLPSSICHYMTEGANLWEMETIYGRDIGDFLAAHYRRDRVLALAWHQEPLRSAALHLAVTTTIHLRQKVRREGLGRQAA